MENLIFVSPSSAFKGQTFTGELSGVDSPRALRQSVLRKKVVHRGKYSRSQYELEKKLKELEPNLNSEANVNEYAKCKNELELIYERIAEGVKIRSKCQWYEEGENSTKVFLNLDKKQSVKALVRKLEVNEKEIYDQAKINYGIKVFFGEGFKFHKGKSFTNLSTILNSIDLPCLTNEQKDF